MHNEKYSIEFPYRIGTIVELKQNPNILAEIKHYIVTTIDNKEIIIVSLSTKIHESDPDYEFEITTNELEASWRRTDKIILGSNIGTRINLKNNVKTLKVIK